MYNALRFRLSAEVALCYVMLMLLLLSWLLLKQNVRPQMAHLGLLTYGGHVRLVECSKLVRIMLIVYR